MTTLLPIRSDDGLVSEVARLSGQNLYACYQCGKCTAGCPFSFEPQLVIRHLQLGQLESAASLNTAWECASCFTCMAACPKGVDPVSIMKTLRTLPDKLESNGTKSNQTLPKVYNGHRKTLRSQLFAKNHRLARLGSRFAPASNWLLKFPGANLVAHYALGIHKSRSFPTFATQDFPTWFEGHTPVGDGHRGKVLLFHDTFMDFNLPETGIATTELLEKAGFDVELTNNVCCGRPMMTKDFPMDAAQQARTNVARLYEQVRDGAFIVGCEPSCLLSLRDEYPDLVDEELKDKAQVVAKQALLIDEFLAMLSADGELELEFRSDQVAGKPVLFHGHCHQKARADVEKSMELLNLAGYKAEMVNAVCCGMAGAFGYEKEHFEASKATFERDLSPAVRANPDTEVAVMGISCRQQIEHFTGRKARHLTQVLRDAVI